jgi:hypothetical protein
MEELKGLWKKLFKKITIVYILAIILSFKGAKCYWNDFTNYLVVEKLKTLDIKIEDLELEVEVQDYQKQKLADKIFREKGIVITDAQIDSVKTGTLIKKWKK